MEQNTNTLEQTVTKAIEYLELANVAALRAVSASTPGARAAWRSVQAENQARYEEQRHIEALHAQVDAQLAEDDMANADRAIDAIAELIRDNEYVRLCVLEAAASGMSQASIREITIGAVIAALREAR